LKYHTFNTSYIENRINELGNRFKIRILLVFIDCENDDEIEKLNLLAINSDCTIIFTFSSLETARYIESYSILEKKSADILMNPLEKNHFSMLIDALSSTRVVNKSDSENLIHAFKSLKEISISTVDDFMIIPGFSHKKACQLYELFNRSFKIQNADD
ncbi:Mating-type switching protein swi10, partial [Intoshia linei]